MTTGTGSGGRDGWARLRRYLWQPPRPHGEQPRKRAVGPLELFYDLAVVVLVAQAAHHLAGHLSWGGLGEFTVVFTLVWIAWVNGSLHHELHGRDDARARTTFLLQILVLAAMGAFIIIVLGETLTGVVAGLASKPVSALTLGAGLVAVVVGFGAWWTYFDFAGNRCPRPGKIAAMHWMIGHLPLTAAIATMGAAMASLVDHAHDARTPAATAWVLSAAAATVLGSTMLVAASLPDWRRDRGLYRPLAGTCAVVAAACLGVGALRPGPLVLGIALVVLLGIPWALAVAHRVAAAAGSPAE